MRPTSQRMAASDIKRQNTNPSPVKPLLPPPLYPHTSLYPTKYTNIRHYPHRRHRHHQHQERNDHNSLDSIHKYSLLFPILLLLLFLRLSRFILLILRHPPV